MKQYTNNEQTAKLIELGFDKPKSIRYPKNEMEAERVNTTDFLISDYSIGELIEILGVHLSSIYYIGIEWFVNAEGIERRREELIDALYDMVIKLKEKGMA